jgi:hypothetical protein
MRLPACPTCFSLLRYAARSRISGDRFNDRAPLLSACSANGSDGWIFGPPHLRSIAEPGSWSTRSRQALRVDCVDDIGVPRELSVAELLIVLVMYHNSIAFLALKAIKWLVDFRARLSESSPFCSSPCCLHCSLASCRRSAGLGDCDWLSIRDSRPHAGALRNGGLQARQRVLHPRPTMYSLLVRTF